MYFAAKALSLQWIGEFFAVGAAPKQTGKGAKKGSWRMVSAGRYEKPGRFQIDAPFRLHYDRDKTCRNKR